MQKSEVFNIVELILKSIREEATAGELEQLQLWIGQDDDNRKFYEELNNADSLAWSTGSIKTLI